MINKSEIATGFREFQNEPIDPRVALYGTDHSQVIGQVFILVKESSNIIGNTDGSKQRMEFSFPIAKVLQVGTRWKGTNCNVGDLVRMRDNDVKTSLNPAWKDYNKVLNDVKDGNMTPVTAAPEMYQCNLRSTFDRRYFNPDPFNLDGAIRQPYWGWDIFFLDEAHILMPIENADLLLEVFLKQLPITQNQN